MTRTGGELLAETLADFGVEVVFGLHGGHLDAFLLGCRRHGIRLVDTRHEAVAVDAAAGYARSTGRLGVAFATASSGYSNALAGVTAAHADRVPVLLITSSPPLRDDETNALQGGIHPIPLVAPVSRWAGTATVAEELPRLVSLAIRHAVAAAPGPAVLDVPIDVMFSPVAESRLSDGGGTRLPAAAAPPPETVSDTLRLLHDAARPVIIVGGGGRAGSVPPLVQQFAERTGIPVFAHPATFGALPADHRLNGYSAANLAPLTAAGRGPDVVLLLGARPGMFLGGRSGTVLPPTAKIVQVDTDATEIGRLLPFEIGITADTSQMLRGLLGAEPDTHWPDRSAWAEKAVAVHRAPAQWENHPSEVGGRLHPFHAVREVLRSLTPGARIIVDGGEMAGWVAASLHEARPRSVIGFGGYLGFLGVTFGLAVGTQIAHPDDQVVLMIGDGAFGFHPQELDTMVRHQLPILTVVVNNACWGMSLHGQQEMFGPEGEVVSRLADTDYDQVAAGFGALGERVSTLDGIRPAIRRASGTGRPTLINLDVAGQVVHPGTPAMVGFTHDPGVVVIPYYDNILLR